MENTKVDVSSCHANSSNLLEGPAADQRFQRQGDQCTADDDVGTSLPRREKLTAELQQQLRIKDEIIQILKEENKLQRGRLKGYEALATLYQQSKTECSRLSRQCAEQENVLEGYMRRSSSLDDTQVETPVLPGHATDLHSVDEATCTSKDPAGGSDSRVADGGNKNISLIDSLPNSLLSIGCDKPMTGTADTEEAAVGLNGDCRRSESDDSFLLLEVPSQFDTANDKNCNEECEENQRQRSLESPLHLDSTNNEPSNRECDGNRYQRNLETQLEFDSMIKETSDKECEENQDPGKPSNLHDGNSSNLLRLPELSIIEQHLLNPEATQESKSFLMELLAVGVKLITLDEQVQQQELCNLSARELPCITDNRDLNMKVQILQEQVMTFKYDFDQERRDREKARSKYDLLKVQFDCLSDNCHRLRSQLRTTEAKLQDVEKENMSLKQQVRQMVQFKNIDEARKRRADPLIPKVVQHGTCTGTHQHKPSGISDTWPCMRCTYENPFPRQTCELCGMEEMQTVTLTSKQLDFF